MVVIAMSFLKVDTKSRQVEIEMESAELGNDQMHAPMGKQDMHGGYDNILFFGGFFLSHLIYNTFTVHVQDSNLYCILT